jgi:hypothetical protein
MSIVDDFAAIGGRLAEIEKIPAKDMASGGYISVPSAAAETWMYTAPITPVVWTPEHGYGSTDTAPSEYCAPAVDCG